MKISCEICGAYTTDEKEIEKAKKNNICPVCLHIGGAYTLTEPTAQPKKAAKNSAVIVKGEKK